MKKFSVVSKEEFTEFVDRMESVEQSQALLMKKIEDVKEMLKKKIQEEEYTEFVNRTANNFRDTAKNINRVKSDCAKEHTSMLKSVDKKVEAVKSYCQPHLESKEQLTRRIQNLQTKLYSLDITVCQLQHGDEKRDQKISLIRSELKSLLSLQEQVIKNTQAIQNEAYQRVRIFENLHKKLDTLNSKLEALLEN